MGQDYTPTGMRVEGPFENDRNARMRECFKEVIRKVYGVQDVIVGHHLVYVVAYKDKDGFEIQVIEEIPAADTLLFDHDVAQKLWGDEWQGVLTRLACTPVGDRDELFRSLYYGRHA